MRIREVYSKAFPGWYIDPRAVVQEVGIYVFCAFTITLSTDAFFVARRFPSIILVDHIEYVPYIIYHITHTHTHTSCFVEIAPGVDSGSSGRFL